MIQNINTKLKKIVELNDKMNLEGGLSSNFNITQNNLKVPLDYTLQLKDNPSFF